MLKNLEMLFRWAELTHASDKFDITTKEFGADKKFGARSFDEGGLVPLKEINHKHCQ